MTACDAVHMVLDQQAEETLRRVDEQLKVQRMLPAAREKRGSGEGIKGKEGGVRGSVQEGGAGGKTGTELEAGADGGSSANTRRRKVVRR